MLVCILGLIGSGKSTVASHLSRLMGFRLFDMDSEFPEEYRSRHRNGEVVPACDVLAYQYEMIGRLLKIEREEPVVMAGFFLDEELPKIIESATSPIWINLITENRSILEQRIVNRKNHFANGLAILNDNWPNRHNQIVGDRHVDCARPLELVLQACIDHIQKEG